MSFEGAILETDDGTRKVIRALVREDEHSATLGESFQTLPEGE